MANKTLLAVENISSEALMMEMEKRVSKIIDAKIFKLHPPTNEDRYITRQDVADMFHITLPTVHNLMNAGILKPYKVGHKTRFLLSEVKAAAINSGNKKEVGNV
jgi:predicted DNA-binding transcriptional regulator AlpA